MNELDIIISRMTHELMAPLAAIRAAGDLLQRESLKRGYEFEYDYLEDIANYCSLMARVVTQARLMASSTSSTISTSPRRVSLLKEVVTPTITLCQVMLRERGLSPDAIKAFGFERIPPLFADPNLIQQVVFNLLSNAIKYGATRDRQARIEIEARDSGKSFEFRFRDWGVGISSLERDSIFESGYRGRIATQHDVTGQGIGLFVADKILRAHGGDVTVSSLSKPTEFIMRLPRQLAQAPHISPSVARKLMGESEGCGNSQELTPQRLLWVIENSTVAHIKGSALEELVAMLLVTVEGFTLHEKRILTETEEIDISIINGSTDPVWRREGAIVIAECKNWSSKCGKNELVIFKQKMLNRNERCTCGVFVSWNGYTSAFTSEMLRDSQSKSLILTLDGSDIREAVKTGDFAAVLSNAWRKSTML